MTCSTVFVKVKNKKLSQVCARLDTLNKLTNSENFIQDNTKTPPKDYKKNITGKSIPELIDIQQYELSPR